MDVSHIIRGDDHLINAARQKQIYDALEWKRSKHVAYPADPRTRRPRNCRSATARLASTPYRAMGYLPAALRNYLVRLG